MKFDLIKEPIAGIGVTGFNRIAPAYFCSNYQIICYKDGSDIDSLKKITTIKSIQADFRDRGDLSRLNTSSILRHRGVVSYLKSLPGSVKLFVYRRSERIDYQARRLGLSILANPYYIRDRYENKQDFFRLGRQIGLPMIPGEQWEIDRINEIEYQNLARRLGDKLVFQLTDIYLGGGRGTFFVNNLNDFHRFRIFVNKKRQEKKLITVNITKYISGLSPSISACITRYGVLTGPVGTQVLDIPELAGRGTNGAFCGHDWSFRRYSSSVQKQADSIARKLGQHMYRNGYKGIFGLDLVIDRLTGKVYPVECNPRYTGVFPVLSLIQLAQGEIPFDVFQLWEFLGYDYRIDFNRVNESFKQPKNGAHLVLYNPHQGHWAEVKGNLPAGVYSFGKAGRLEFVRPGATYQDINKSDEFVFTDGCPRPRQLIKPGLRVGKLIFKRQVLLKPGVLNEFARMAIEQVMKGLLLRQPALGPQRRSG